MDQSDRRDILKTVFLSFWAMATLILLFCVVLLVNEMMRSGQDPLGSLLPAPKAEQTAGAAPAAAQQEMGNRDIALFFADESARLLTPEIRRIEYTSSVVENCRRALQLLIEGPRGAVSPLFPPSAKINALYALEGGELIIDFSRELAMDSRIKSASLEALLFYGVVQTVTQDALQSKEEARIERVRFLIEGAAPQETFPAHLDLSQPLKPDPQWTEPAHAG